jgi:hypothetical protein
VELLSVINRGATSLIADMTATISCGDGSRHTTTRPRATSSTQ